MYIHVYTQGYGLGGLDFYDGYVQYKLLDPSALSTEIGDMSALLHKDYNHFSCTQVNNINNFSVNNFICQSTVIFVSNALSSHISYWQLYLSHNDAVISSNLYVCHLQDLPGYSSMKPSRTTATITAPIIQLTVSIVTVHYTWPNSHTGMWNSSCLGIDVTPMNMYFILVCQHTGTELNWILKKMKKITECNRCTTYSLLLWSSHICDFLRNRGGRWMMSVHV